MKTKLQLSKNVTMNKALAALEAGQEEVLADELSRELKRGLSAPHAAYLGNAPATLA